MKSFRLRVITPKEKDVQQAIIEYLGHEQSLGRVVYFKRNNGGGMEREHKGTKRWTWFYMLYMPGEKMKSRDYPDIDGLLSDGRALFLEVKRPGGNVRDGQARFIELAAAHGAAAGIVESVEDALKVVRGE